MLTWRSSGCCRDMVLCFFFKKCPAYRMTGLLKCFFSRARQGSRVFYQVQTSLANPCTCLVLLASNPWNLFFLASLAMGKLATNSLWLVSWCRFRFAVLFTATIAWQIKHVGFCDVVWNVNTNASVQDSLNMRFSVSTFLFKRTRLMFSLLYGPVRF